MLSNVGNLITPVTRDAVLNNSALIPDDLYAHNHQQSQWMKGQSSVPTSLLQSGWGGHHLVMGGAVNGNNLFGELLSFEINGADDSGDKGRVIPNLSINQYGALLGEWMGISQSDLNEVFPDLANFGGDWASGIDLFGV